MELKRFPIGRATVPAGPADHRYEADVVIVGGAVAGASMAHALAEHGISSVVLERGDAWPEINRGDALQPLTLGFFERWDVLRYMDELGAYPIREWEFINPRIGSLGTWSFVDLPFKFQNSVILRHVKIHRALYAAMEPKRDLIQPRRGHHVTGVVVDSEAGRIVGAAGTVGEGSGAETFEAVGKLVVAADGPSSKVREFVGIEVTEHHRYDHEYLMLMVPRPDLPELDRRGIRYVGRHALTVLIPLDGGQDMRIPVQIPAGSLPEWRRLTAAQLRHRLLVRAPILEHTDTSSAMDRLSHAYKVHWQHAHHYVRDNVCLIGEAAHTIHPTTAQGMNMAILDAEVLAAVIKRCFDRDGVSDDALRLYESSRWKTNAVVMETSHAQGLHHTAAGIWHDIWGVRRYRWMEDENFKRELAIRIAGLKNPTSKELGILDYELETVRG
jgi:2-polyprenyl-6-methoxyphenol hydroxylase-like FAD-dependent oxidoreductase